MLLIMRHSKLLKIVLFTLVSVVFAFTATTLYAQAPDLPDVFYVHSQSPALKALLGVDHEFDGVFSAQLSGRELGLVQALGVRVERVQIRRIDAPPNKCGDGTCQGFETANSCPVDCAGGTNPTPTPTPASGTRSCFPDYQTPYGVSMINGGTGGAGVTVAVLDTGVMQDHPDLTNRITSCTTQVTHFRSDSKSCDDGHGHGTHVSGTVLADGGTDGLGIRGVAPEANLMTVKVCDRRGYCYGDDVAAGIRYAADHGAHIISMSFGGDAPDSQEQAAITYAISRGVMVVAAAGNDGPANGSINYPGAFVEVSAVGAIDANRHVPDWSSRGINDGDYIYEAREVEFGTPGVSVESTLNNGCFAYYSGTSMATPHVSGLAAKLWQGSAAQTRSYLHTLSQDIWDPGDDTATGFGLPISP
jgi:subtilisin